MIHRILFLAFLTCSFQSFADDNHKIVTDNNGNVFVFGEFNGQLHFPNGTSVGDTTDNYNQCFLAKYDSTGACLWARAIRGAHAHGTTHIDFGIYRGIDLTVDDAGNLYITAMFRDTLFLDEFTMIPSASLETKAFIAKYSTDGLAVWAKEIEGAQFGIGVDVDNQGYLYAVGMFLTIVSDAGQVILNGINNGLNSSSEIYVYKMDTAGNTIWIEAISGVTNGLGANSLAVSNSQSVYVVGYPYSSGFMNPGGIVAGSVSSDSLNTYLVKFSPSGAAQWVKTFDYSAGGIIIDRIRVNSQDELVMEGALSGSVDFGGTTTPILTGPSTRSPFVAKLDTNGNAIWSLVSDPLNTGPIGYGTDVEVDSGDNIWFSARSQGIEYSPLQSETFTEDSTSWSIVKLDSNGAGLCQVLYDVHGAQPLNLATDQNDNAYFVSFTDENYLWSNGNYSYYDGLLKVGKIDSNCSLLWESTAINNYYYYWNSTPENYVENIVVTVYPNPVSDIATLDFDGVPLSGKLKLRNALGKLVHETDLVQQESHQLELQGLSAGMYYLEVLVEEKQIKRLKLNYLPK